MDPISAALIGAALGVAGTIVSTHVKTHRDREAWWRDQRVAAYAEFLESIENGFRASVEENGGDSEARGPAVEAMKRAIARVELLGPPAVFGQALVLMNDTCEAIGIDPVDHEPTQDRFESLQRFIRQSKIALGEPGIAGDSGWRSRAYRVRSRWGHWRTTKRIKRDFPDNRTAVEG